MENDERISEHVQISCSSPELARQEVHVLGTRQFRHALLLHMEMQQLTLPLAVPPLTPMRKGFSPLPPLAPDWPCSCSFCSLSPAMPPPSLSAAAGSWELFEETPWSSQVSTCSPASLPGPGVARTTRLLGRYRPRLRLLLCAGDREPRHPSRAAAGHAHPRRAEDKQSEQGRVVGAPSCPAGVAF